MVDMPKYPRTEGQASAFAFCARVLVWLVMIVPRCVAQNQVKPSSATKVPDPSGTSEDQDDLFDAGLKSTELDFSEDELNEHGPITEEQKQRYTNYAEILDNMRVRSSKYLCVVLEALIILASNFAPHDSVVPHY